MKDKGKTNYKENHVFFAVYFGCVTFHIQAILTFYVNAREKVNLAIHDDGNVHRILPYLRE